MNFFVLYPHGSFYEYHKEYDVVFATVHLDTAVPQFLVKPIMDDNDLHNLRKKGVQRAFE